MDLMMAIGSLLVLVTAALIVPGVAMLGRRDADPRGLGERLLDVPLDRSAAWTRRYPLKVGLGAGLLACAMRRRGDLSAHHTAEPTSGSRRSPSVSWSNRWNGSAARSSPPPRSQDSLCC